jgi:hypothetical protein
MPLDAARCSQWRVCSSPPSDTYLTDTYVGGSFHAAGVRVVGAREANFFVETAPQLRLAHIQQPDERGRCYGTLGRGGRTLVPVSTVEQPEEPTVRFFPADEALKRARPLPSAKELEIEGLTEDEWAAFQEALAEV